MIDALTHQAHRFLRPYLSPGAVCIDATAGNGHDTKFLAECVGSTGLIYAFDIQPPAIAATRETLANAGLTDRVRIIEADHADMAGHLDPEHAGGVQAIVFNLGYLPGGDPSITTLTASTVTALNVSLSLLTPTGILSVMLYPGHPEGKDEATAIRAWATDLDPDRWTSAIYGLLNRSGLAPSLILVQKR